MDELSNCVKRFRNFRSFDRRTELVNNCNSMYMYEQRKKAGNVSCKQFGLHVTGMRDSTGVQKKRECVKIDMNNGRSGNVRLEEEEVWRNRLSFMKKGQKILRVRKVDHWVKK